MGYKLAGFDVIGNVEIDPRVMEVYKKNNHPKYPFLMDVRDFLQMPNDELPEELFHLDVLDGSPPCSVFSIAGGREKGWGKEKTFREGQKKQSLDDLFFYFIRIADKLKPKVVIAENVSGLIKGKAKGYVNEIFKAFKNAGYSVQLFLLNSATMGVPQARERCFFIAHRDDLNFEKLHLEFKENPITYGEIREENGIDVNPDTDTYRMLEKRTKYDFNIGDIRQREKGKASGFTHYILHDDRVANTMTAGGEYFRFVDGKFVSKNDIVHIQTFPHDYDFMDQTPIYICGMSVPPVMMAQIASEVYRQWLA